jgi:hypothetical protein
MGVGGRPYAAAAFTSGKDPVPIVQEAGWARGPVWTSAENLAPPGFDPRTVQPVASRYTDYAIPDPKMRGRYNEIVNAVASWRHCFFFVRDIPFP